MRFLYGKQQLCSLSRAQEHSFLLTNGLGGYASLTSACSVDRCDQGLLVAAVRAPNERIGMVHRLQETLRTDRWETSLSTQEFADRTLPEEGFRHLSRFSVEHTPCWVYQTGGVQVERRCAVAHGKNTAAVLYQIENLSELPCTLSVRPCLRFASKEQPLEGEKDFFCADGRITDGTYTLYFRTDGEWKSEPARWEVLSYPEDGKDGRPDRGMAASCCVIHQTVQPGERAELEIVFSMEPTQQSAREILRAQHDRMRQLERDCGFSDPVARQLAVSADAYIAHRDSTGGKTILAGYPLFSDWGRDTMIALPGCTLATGRYEDAKSILRTFLAYEKDGLVPNLFPEGEQKPMYNTADAALLLINCIWQYWERTADLAFVEEAWPVMERIAAAYQSGTRHAIGMDTDGLIRAGSGLDQVTWMDVCVQGILPTPRHGKPVEINAYWYSALCVLEELSRVLGRDGSDYGVLAKKVKQSFCAAFYRQDAGCLRDVISGTEADDQLRCNQIWAVSMPFTMLTAAQERSVVDTVYRHLYTPCGLRTLSPEDPQYHPCYGGDQLTRDLAYHQGTVWVFPLGAFYLAYLKTRGFCPAAIRWVRRQLEALVPMLAQGCAGQLPEIYDGDFPAQGKGCFAQAWSVGEMLRVYEALEHMKTDKEDPDESDP